MTEDDMDKQLAELEKNLTGVKPRHDEAEEEKTKERKHEKAKSEAPKVDVKKMLADLEARMIKLIETETKILSEHEKKTSSYFESKIHEQDLNIDEKLAIVKKTLSGTDMAALDLTLINELANFVLDKEKTHVMPKRAYIIAHEVQAQIQQARGK